MVGLCKGGNEPPGSLKANQLVRYMLEFQNRKNIQNDPSTSQELAGAYLSEELVTQEKRKKGWRMNCDVGKATEGLENEL